MEKIPEQKFNWGYAIFLLIALFVIGFFAAFIASIFSGTEFETIGGNVAVIPIEGVIMGSDSSGLFEETVTSKDTIKLIEKAEKNPSIKAVLFEINSPGGSAVASEEIANAIRKINKTKAALIREVGASGGYWIASSTDYVVANRVSITGSIGVIASYLEFPGLLGEYNVTYRRLVAGKYKDIGSPFKEMTDEEQKLFQEDLDIIRDYFVSEVAKNRKMSKKDVDKIANGLFYLGVQAKELGLVDELGGRDEAIRYIEQKEGITAEIVEYKTEKGLLELLSDVISKQSFFIGKGIGSSFFENKVFPGIRT